MIKLFKVRATSLALAAAFFVPAKAENDLDTVAKGRAIIEANCARCHAIGKDDTSQHARRHRSAWSSRAIRQTISPKRWLKA